MPPHTGVILHERQLLCKIFGVFLLDIEVAGAGGAEELDQDGGALFGRLHVRTAEE